jgi:hypothetical protein
LYDPGMIARGRPDLFGQRRFMVQCTKSEMGQQQIRVQQLGSTHEDLSIAVDSPAK